MSDYKELSQQDHELNYILAKFGKRETEENREILKQIESNFKALHGGESTKQYTKEEFYDFLQQEENINLLEEDDDFDEFLFNL